MNWTYDVWSLHELHECFTAKRFEKTTKKSLCFFCNVALLAFFRFLASALGMFEEFCFRSWVQARKCRIVGFVVLEAWQKPFLQAKEGSPAPFFLGGSVHKPLAGFLPAARRAPHVSVLHPVHLSALLTLTSGLPAASTNKHTHHYQPTHSICVFYTCSLGMTGGKWTMLNLEVVSVENETKYLSEPEARGRDESTGMVWERCSLKPCVCPWVGEACNTHQLIYYSH